MGVRQPGRSEVDFQFGGDALVQEAGGEVEEALLLGPVRAARGDLRGKPCEIVVLVIQGRVVAQRGSEGRNQVDAILLPLVKVIH